MSSTSCHQVQMRTAKRQGTFSISIATWNVIILIASDSTTIMPLETRRQAALKLAEEKRMENRKRSAPLQLGTQKAAKLSQKDASKDNSRHLVARMKIDGPRPTLVLRKRNDESKAKQRRAPLRALPPATAVTTSATVSLDPTAPARATGARATGQTSDPALPTAAQATSRSRHASTGSLSALTSNPELSLAVAPARRHRSSSVDSTKKKVLPDVVPPRTQAGASKRKSRSTTMPVTPSRPLVLIDPDANKDDPQLCIEYAKDIYKHWLEIERRNAYLITEDFMTSVFFVRPSHRAVLIDWLFQIQPQFHLLNETMYLCVDILDRVLQVSSP